MLSACREGVKPTASGVARHLAATRFQSLGGLADGPQIFGQPRLQIEQVLPLPLFDRDPLGLLLPHRLDQAPQPQMKVAARARRSRRPGPGAASWAAPAAARCTAGPGHRAAGPGSARSPARRRPARPDSSLSSVTAWPRSAERSWASRRAISSREPNSTSVRPRLIMSPGRTRQSWTFSPLTLVPLVLSRSVSTSFPSSSWIFRWKRLIRSSLSWTGLPSSRPRVTGVGRSSKTRPRSAPSRIRKVISAI